MFVPETLQIPLKQDNHGVIQVSGTRVPLERGGVRLYANRFARTVCGTTRATRGQSKRAVFGFPGRPAQFHFKLF